jgi:hypothetical protein
MGSTLKNAVPVLVWMVTCVAAGGERVLVYVRATVLTARKGDTSLPTWTVTVNVLSTPGGFNR